VRELNKMNELLKIVMRTEDLSRKEAIEYIKDEYEDSNQDVELTLRNLGLEPDYFLDLIDIVK
jgi:hypothetical protein